MQTVPPYCAGILCKTGHVAGDGASVWPGWVTEMSPQWGQLKDKGLVSLILLGSLTGGNFVLFPDKLGGPAYEI